jgi:hypothetical protein
LPITQLDKLRPARCGKVLPDVIASYIWHRSTYLKAVIYKLTIYDSIMHVTNTRQHFRNCRIIRLSKVSPNTVVWLVVPMRIRRVLVKETQYPESPLSLLLICICQTVPFFNSLQGSSSIPNLTHDHAADRTPLDTPTNECEDVSTNNFPLLLRFLR